MDSDGKSRILEAAIKIFAEKSFEGSRIDEIAREAGVPKSLIYYHFKNKDEILEVLTERFIDEYTQLLKVGENDTGPQKAEKLAERLKNHYFEFEKKNADLIRIMLIDSLKKSNKEPVLFRVVKTMIEEEKKYPANAEGFDVSKNLIAEFFTRMMPDYAYLCFSDAWTDYFHISREELDSDFVQIIADTHGAFHKSQNRRDA